MEQKIFERTDPPANFACSAAGRHVSWLTWSRQFRAFLRAAENDIRSFPAPSVIYIPELPEYNRTLTLSDSKWSSPEQQSRFLAFADSLLSTWPSDDLILLDDMLGPHLNGPQLQKIFALLRDKFTELAGDARAATCAPPYNGRRDFPLHADLYIPQILFLVFNSVPADDSGASIFLPVSILQALLPTVKSLPDRISHNIMAMFEVESGKDRFEDLYDLLHGPHQWVPELEMKMREAQFRIKLNSGQGYLLHDRAWLHGREPPSSGYLTDRFHRLVFTASCRKSETSAGLK